MELAATGIVGRIVGEGDGEGDELSGGLDAGLVTTSGAVDRPAMAGAMPQLVRVFNNRTSSRIGASTGAEPLLRPR